MLNSWLLLIISRLIMLWNMAAFSLEVLIYKVYKWDVIMTSSAAMNI